MINVSMCMCVLIVYCQLLIVLYISIYLYLSKFYVDTARCIVVSLLICLCVFVLIK